MKRAPTQHERFARLVSGCHVFRSLWNYDHRMQSRKQRSYPGHTDRWKLLSFFCHYLKTGPKKARRLLFQRFPSLSPHAKTHVIDTTASLAAYIQTCNFACQCSYCREHFAVFRNPRTGLVYITTSSSGKRNEDGEGQTQIASNQKQGPDSRRVEGGGEAQAAQRGPELHERVHYNQHKLEAQQRQADQGGQEGAGGRDGKDDK